MEKRYYEDGTVKQSDCNHPAYSLDGGELRCVVCGKESTSKKWRTNVFGQKPAEEKAAGEKPVEEKAVKRETTENKGLARPTKEKHGRR